MTDLVRYEQPSPLLRLPAETRLQIYRHLIPKDVLDVDICSPRRSAAQQFGSLPRPGASILVAQLFAWESLIRDNGLQMLLVCRRTRDEVLPFLSKLTVRFHCTKCFEQLLSNMSHGLGVGVKWMKHVEIRYQCEDSGTVLRSVGGSLTPQLSKFMVSEAMFALQRTAWLYYGRLDLLERDKWKFEPVPTNQKSTSTTPDQITAANHVMLPAPGSLPPVFGHTFVPAPPLRHVNKLWVISGWFDT
ncbi:hypothetical protein LTR10_020952 [Elasticomyces elasticus]|uniref:F-box domain-containing protein n=1 Tax=Exophiala sideris TaxID=1016849 RepID=A0ABR0JBK8_9EURO|nr:hypothetical protein LTR10_020952 [Elasticomyces elasticus]KAK5031089.1 hypothetical protein LTS07_004824 [Exophiala sideris]KAK5038811.1 hypothetical protein LTR13_003842 [Exophiala sideris]KAK5060694.1 hypothetical protein LTR69_005293 [Exophiala sideris]KAK5183607.1 hypothetical protein LTR44_003889 [Eurotiomycetes sp. CCFEE 6388]